MNDNSLDYSMYSGFCCAVEDGNDTTFGSLASEGQSAQAVGVAPRRALAYGQQDGEAGRSGLYRTPEPFSYGQVAGVHAFGTTDPSQWPVGAAPASAFSPATNHGLLEIELEPGPLATHTACIRPKAGHAGSGRSFWYKQYAWVHRGCCGTATATRSTTFAREQP